MVSRVDGTDFTVTVDAEPAGLSTGQNLLSGVVSDVVTALSAGDVTQISTNGVEAFDLSQAFELTIDEDPNDANATDAIMVDLSAMTRAENSALSGEEVAALMTQEINRQFGDQRFFNVSSDANRQFRVLFDADGDDVTGTEETSTPLQVVDVFIPASTQYTEESLAAEITSQLRAARIPTLRWSIAERPRASSSPRKMTRASYVSQTYGGGFTYRKLGAEYIIRSDDPIV